MSVQDRHAVQVLAEFGPGGATGKHTHPGEEVGYLLEGTLVLEVDGQPPRTLKAGDAFFVEPGKVHNGKNVGSGAGVAAAGYPALIPYDEYWRSVVQDAAVTSRSRTRAGRIATS